MFLIFQRLSTIQFVSILDFIKSHPTAMSLGGWLSLSLSGPVDSIPSAVIAHSLFGNISIETLNS